MITFSKFFKENKNYTIFCDLDGVLVNFAKGFSDSNEEKLTPKKYEEKYGKHSISRHLQQFGTKFWEDLEWMPDGKQLWNYIQPLNPTILSAPSPFEESKMGKVMWLKKHINLPNYDVQTKTKHGWDGKSKVILSGDKYKFANGPTSILIDDTIKKIEPWINAGGTGILHTSANETIHKLKQIIKV